MLKTECQLTEAGMAANRKRARQLILVSGHAYSKDDIMAGLIQGVRHRCMIYDDNYAECIGIYQDQGERKSETMIKKKAIFAVITMMMLILAAGCGYTSDEACIWCGAMPTKAIKSELDGETVTKYYCEECSTTCLLCGAKATQQFTNESGVDVFLCDDCAAGMTE